MVRRGTAAGRRQQCSVVLRRGGEVLQQRRRSGLVEEERSQGERRPGALATRPTRSDSLHPTVRWRNDSSSSSTRPPGAQWPNLARATGQYRRVVFVITVRLSLLLLSYSTCAGCLHTVDSYQQHSSTPLAVII